MGQKAASSGSFGMRCVTDRIADISSSDGGEERAGSETSLYYFGEYRWETKPSGPAGDRATHLAPGSLSATRLYTELIYIYDTIHEPCFQFHYYLLVKANIPLVL